VTYCFLGCGDRGVGVGVGVVVGGLQTLTALGKGRSVTAVSLLNRREPSCVSSFLQAIGTMFDRGVAVSLKVVAAGLLS
jgi:hypothetical protein